MRPHLVTNSCERPSCLSAGSRSNGSDLSKDLLEVVPIADRFEVGLGLEVDAIAEALADGSPHGVDGLDQGGLDLLGLLGGGGPGDLGVTRGKKDALLAVDVWPD